MSAVRALMLDLESNGTADLTSWPHRDGRPQTGAERDLVSSATWADLMAVRDLLELDVELERGVA